MRETCLNGPALLQRAVRAFQETEVKAEVKTIRSGLFLWPDFEMSCKARSLPIHSQHTEIVTDPIYFLCT